MKIFASLLVGWNIRLVTGFLPSPSPSITSPRLNGSASDKNQEEEISGPSFDMDNASIKIDDGGSNLTDRFKYKVHALMGDYDPVEGVEDTETQDGNIMKAFVTFPTQHVFEVVGKNTNDSTGYAEEVRQIVFETTGDEDMECDVIPRGTKFTKVRCKAIVESTTMINAIYEELGQMDSTVMKF